MAISAAPRLGLAEHDDPPLDVDAAPRRLQPGELSRLHVLRRVGLESVWGLLERCRVQLLRSGERLLRAGQSNQIMYMVLAGRLSVHLDLPESEPVAYLEAGQTVGEISVIDDSPATAHVTAACPTRLLAVDEETFWRLVGASHEFATNLLLLLAQRMRVNTSLIMEGARLRRQLERDAMVDGLTGLHNRRWLNDKAPRLVERHGRGAVPLSVLVVDVDHFKRFNDDYGHSAGDQVLAVVARTLSTSLRPTDLAARYGGEEFVVLLPDTDLAGAATAAERLRIAVGGTTVPTHDGRVLPPITVSIGVAELVAGESATALIDRADAALYRAKKTGRNRVERSQSSLSDAGDGAATAPPRTR